jgi:hypothetical protein
LKFDALEDVDTFDGIINENENIEYESLLSTYNQVVEKIELISSLQ